MYEMFVVGNMMKKKDIRKVVLHQEQNGKMFRMISNVHYALLERISSQKLKTENSAYL